MDEDKFKEEAKVLLELAIELSKKAGMRMDIAVFPDGAGWVTPIKGNTIMEDITTGYKFIEK